jgi:hypothetical protein
MQEQQAGSKSMVKLANAWHTGVNDEHLMVRAQKSIYEGVLVPNKHAVCAIRLVYVVDDIHCSGLM